VYRMRDAVSHTLTADISWATAGAGRSRERVARLFRDEVTVRPPLPRPVVDPPPESAEPFLCDK
jgi:hypothetical protein